MNAQAKLLKLQFVSFLPIDSLVALTASIICLSFSPIFIRLSELEIGPNATAFNRFWIAAVAFWLLNTLLTARHRDQNKETQLEQQKHHLVNRAKLLIIDGVLISVGLMLWAWSLNQTSIANSSMIHNLVPIFTVLGGWLALGQTFDNRFLIGMVVAIFGATLLEAKELLSLRMSQELLGSLAALLSAVFFGIHPLVIQRLRSNLSPVTIMTWSTTTSFLFMLPVVLIAKEQLFPTSINGWFAVIAQALVSQMLAMGLWAYCLKKLSAGFSSLVALIIPALSAVEGWAIFSESLNFLTVVSFFVILFGMYLAISSTSAIKLEND
ncbi:MAG: DMT family transporter [Okeania sp. SIO2G4]|uniref:DMT family transporter n=1 Tax=unclassified Okeania TaxID=2634635 RepID=UPI0013BA458F|nr:MULTISPECIES: DMT family transporter [unclassified Okeania]NEP71959.1 DMT family transporter [Okeania sp. SIO2G5]NEP92996.1 DMT family transporter [Okeania sp. SIO2F5]NEQ90664.1 DMT family transporter [Okeania sp. SIO2G4]